MFDEINWDDIDDDDDDDNNNNNNNKIEALLFFLRNSLYDCVEQIIWWSMHTVHSVTPCLLARLELCYVSKYFDVWCLPPVLRVIDIWITQQRIKITFFFFHDVKTDGDNECCLKCTCVFVCVCADVEILSKI
jgi:hypothetical protein